MGDDLTTFYSQTISYQEGLIEGQRRSIDSLMSENAKLKEQIEDLQRRKDRKEEL